jgi:hypothetical protein
MRELRTGIAPAALVILIASGNVSARAEEGAAAGARWSHVISLLITYEIVIAYPVNASLARKRVTSRFHR